MSLCLARELIGILLSSMKLFRVVVLILMAIPALAYASVGDDINALLDKFFGGDQAPIAEEKTEQPLPEPVLEALPTTESLEVRREIMQQEAELESFEEALRSQEKEFEQVHSQMLTSQQQLQLVDQQIELNARKIDFYQTQNAEWETLVEKLTREKSALRAEIRILEREYKLLLSKKFIQKQNFQLNPTVSWWQWMFSDKSVSTLLNERRQGGLEQTQKAAALGKLEKLKIAFDIQEKGAVQALVKVSTFKQQLLKDQIVLNDLAEGKANLLASLSVTKQESQSRLDEYRQAQAETTQYLQTLRQQLLASGPEPTIASVPNTLNWPLALPVRITAGFKDPAYKTAFSREHFGLDMGVSQGTDVLAAAEGVVTKVATDSTGYTYVIVQHDPDLYTIYGHLSKTLVKKDDPVVSGQVMAWSGGTPGTAGAGYFTSGPHLHFEVFSGGQFVDPQGLLPTE